MGCIKLKYFERQGGLGKSPAAFLYPVGRKKHSFEKSFNYSTFGSEMPGRKYVAEDYRFSFNGMEKDDEIKGDGNSINFGARMYDSRLGRWFSRDNKGYQYPGQSPYSFVANSPIFFVDANGNEIFAYGSINQKLVMDAIIYAFGDDHGFIFENNKLVHDGKPLPDNWTDEQRLLFKYFNDGIVKSTTPVIIKPNTTGAIIATDDGDGGLNRLAYRTSEGAATTFLQREKTIRVQERGIRILKEHIPKKIIVSLTPELINEGTISLMTEDGQQDAPWEIAFWHEIGHSFINTNGNETFNDVNYSEWTEDEKTEFSIRFENLVREIKGLPASTGEFQHGKGELDYELPAIQHIKSIKYTFGSSIKPSRGLSSGTETIFTAIKIGNSLGGALGGGSSSSPSSSGQRTTMPSFDY